MATIALTNADRNSVNGAIILSWALAGADDGAPYSLPFSADLTFQVTGTFGGATVKLQGSNNGTDWFDLTKKGGTSALSVTAAGGGTANENPAYIRPIASGGTGSALVATVAIHARYSKVGY